MARCRAANTPAPPTNPVCALDPRADRRAWQPTRRFQRREPLVPRVADSARSRIDQTCWLEWPTRHGITQGNRDRRGGRPFPSCHGRASDRPAALPVAQFRQVTPGNQTRGRGPVKSHETICVFRVHLLSSAFQFFLVQRRRITGRCSQYPEALILWGPGSTKRAG
jgi:hypothetical protein